MRVFPDFEGPMAKWPRRETMPHAKETLAMLKSGWTIALATNAADSSENEIRQALSYAGLSEYIDRVYCYQRIGHRKPSLSFFEYILIDLGLEPPSIIMVGDDYRADVQGANRIGMRAIWFNHRSSENRSGDLHRTIHDLRDLHKILNSWDFKEGGN